MNVTKPSFPLKSLVTAACFGLALLTTSVMAADSTASAQGEQAGKRRGPPPEVFEACESKSSGDTCSFTAPHGEVTGVCQMMREQLSCMPEGGRPEGPPPRLSPE